MILSKLRRIVIDLQLFQSRKPLDNLTMQILWRCRIKLVREGRRDKVQRCRCNLKDYSGQKKVIRGELTALRSTVIRMIICMKVACSEIRISLPTTNNLCSGHWVSTSTLEMLQEKMILSFRLTQILMILISLT